MYNRTLITFFIVNIYRYTKDAWYRRCMLDGITPVTRDGMV